MGVSLTLARGERDVRFAAGLLADILGNATFPAEEFEKEKRIAGIIAERQKGDWQSEAIRFLRAELFGETPYGRPTVGTSETISGLTREDVVEFAGRFLRPEATVVAVAASKIAPSDRRTR